MKWIPVGHRVLIKPDAVEEVSKGGIIVTTESTKRLEQSAQVIGTVVDLGKEAFFEYVEKGFEPWCKVGDRVTYQKYSGMKLPNLPDVLLLNDMDITGVVIEENVNG